MPPARIQLGYKAFDPHELACHFVAEHAGLYARHGIDVELLDTRAIADDDLPPDLFSVACGAALLRWLRGEQMKVIFVAAERPMFRLCVRDGVERLLDLRGGRIAAYPAAAPPALFLRIILEDAGLDPDRDVRIDAYPGDAERLEQLEQLETGAVDAALISSATLPSQVIARQCKELFSLGDRLRVPTTGLAVNLPLFKSDPHKVAAVRDAHREAIRLLHTDASLLHDGLRAAFFKADSDLAEAGELVRNNFSADGLVVPGEIAPGLQRLALAMNLPLLDERPSLYDCTFRVG